MEWNRLLLQKGKLYKEFTALAATVLRRLHAGGSGACCNFCKACFSAVEFANSSESGTIRGSLPLRNRRRKRLPATGLWRFPKAIIVARREL